MSGAESPLRVFLVAGEHSGDQLAGKLIPEIRRLAGRPVIFSGVGGDMMKEQGCPSLFPLSEISVMGPLAILRSLPGIIRRIYQTVAAAAAWRPDILVILDSPEFTHPVAKRIRRRLPAIPVVNYVSPSVWAWRPGRAAGMRGYIDHVLALLPFEPAAHERLGGPDCTYVGHPLIERLEWIQGLDPGDLANTLKLPPERPVLAVLPGSRATEVQRLMAPFGETVARLSADAGPLEVVVPVVGSVRALVEEMAVRWPVTPHLIEGEGAKFRAFRLARAALAASGTATLELALSGTPMAVAYKVDAVAWSMRRLLRVSSVVLPNLILERNVFPEFLQHDCTAENLAAALAPLLQETPRRREQCAAMEDLADRMRLPEGAPSEKAAEIVLALAEGRA